MGEEFIELRVLGGLATDELHLLDADVSGLGDDPRPVRGTAGRSGGDFRRCGTEGRRSVGVPRPGAGARVISC
ncbi:hypothetical protein [Streptomyces sp. NPDC051776]|uniref:hypothetical protein n=1 Tax=Streptomyces sp. NPDC051776 TaxID=3155414 RepID=UPI003448C954